MVHLYKIRADLTIMLFEVESADLRIQVAHFCAPKVLRSGTKTRIALSSHVATNVFSTLEKLFRGVYVWSGETVRV